MLHSWYWNISFYLQPTMLWIYTCRVFKASWFKKLSSWILMLNKEWSFRLLNSESMVLFFFLTLLKVYKGWTTVSKVSGVMLLKGSSRSFYKTSTISFFIWSVIAGTVIPYLYCSVLLSKWWYSAAWIQVACNRIEAFWYLASYWEPNV